MRSIKCWGCCAPRAEAPAVPTLVALLNMILRRFFGLAN
jgi:hypothetical protein